MTATTNATKATTKAASARLKPPSGVVAREPPVCLCFVPFLLIVLRRSPSTCAVSKIVAQNKVCGVGDGEAGVRLEPALCSVLEVFARFLWSVQCWPLASKCTTHPLEPLGVGVCLFRTPSAHIVIFVPLARTMASLLLDGNSLRLILYVLAVLVCIGAVAVASRSLLLVVRLVQTNGGPNGFARCTPILCSYLAWLVCRGKGDGDTDLEMEVKRMLSDRRVETARSCVSIAGVFLSGRNTLIVMDVIAGEEREDPLGKDVTLVFLQIVLVVFSSFPSLLNARTLCFVHSVLVACLALSVTPFVGDYDPKMMLHRVACTFGAFFAGFVCLDFQVFIFTNTLFTATAIVSAMSTWNPSLGVPMHDVVDVELLTFVLRVGMLWKAGALLEESVRREITAKSDACQSAGMSGLLSLMCDAVVDLNEDFVMKEHVEKLAGMLMHRGGQCTEDRNCMSFIEGGDDLQRFEEGIKQFRGESPPDEALVGDVSGASSGEVSTLR